MDQINKIMYFHSFLKIFHKKILKTEDLLKNIRKKKHIARENGVNFYKKILIYKKK